VNVSFHQEEIHYCTPYKCSAEAVINAYKQGGILVEANEAVAPGSLLSEMT